MKVVFFIFAVLLVVLSCDNPFSPEDKSNEIVVRTNITVNWSTNYSDTNLNSVSTNNYNVISNYGFTITISVTSNFTTNDYFYLLITNSSSTAYSFSSTNLFYETNYTSQTSTNYYGITNYINYVITNNSLISNYGFTNVLYIITNCYTNGSIYYCQTNIQVPLNYYATTNYYYSISSGGVKFYNYTRGYLKFSTISNSYFFVDSYYSYTKYFPASVFYTYYYTVTVEGRYKFEETATVTVNPALTSLPVYTLSVFADAGAIEVSNASSVNIIGVFLSPSTSTTWGENDILSNIEPTKYETWRVTATSLGTWWDAKIYMSDGKTYTFSYPDNEITVYKEYTEKITVYSVSAYVNSIYSRSALSGGSELIEATENIETERKPLTNVIAIDDRAEIIK